MFPCMIVRKFARNILEDNNNMRPPRESGPTGIHQPATFFARRSRDRALDTAIHFH